ncbi:hypothetical protein ACOME3_008083 [Neoechinorhynchus agilis]
MAPRGFHNCSDEKCQHTAATSLVDLEPLSETVATESVATKYIAAGEIATKVLIELIGLCADGALIYSLCEYGDRRINELCGNVFKKDKKMRKGVAMPVCISLNNRLAYYSPMENDEKIPAAMKNGDLVKIELGCHVDGYPSVVCYTIVVGADGNNKVTGKKADVIVAAYSSLQIITRMFKPGCRIQEISKLVSSMVENDFHCHSVDNWYSYTISRNNLENDYVLALSVSEPAMNNSGLSNGLPERDLDNQIVAENAVYAIDIAISTGDGKVKDCELRTNVFRKTDSVYQLKVKASRSVLSEVERKFGNTIFSLRNLSNPSVGRMGVVECVSHQVFAPYHVQQEKEGELIARFMTTLLVTPSSTRCVYPITPLDGNVYCSEMRVSHPALISVLTQTVTKKKKRSKAKKAAVATAAAADTSAAQNHLGDEDKNNEIVV